MNLELEKILLDAIYANWNPDKFDDKIISANTSQPEYNLTYEY